MKALTVNREILRLAVPNIISNITIPMLGMIDMAIAGRLGEDAAIGGLAIGTAIFNFIYWNCAFIRMGTSGITAQAYGAGRADECADILLRSVAVAAAMALVLLAMQKPLGRLSFALMNGSEKTTALAAEYFYARIWAAPATVSLYAVHGWFIGMQDSRTPMFVAIAINIINVAFSLLFVYRFGMGIAGIAWGTVVSQYGGLVMSWIIWLFKYRSYARRLSLRRSLRMGPMRQFFGINRDVFLRTACLVAVYTFFTSASSSYGDVTLAANTLLMQLFTLFSYMLDGFAYAAESLTGRFIGEQNRSALRESIRKLIVWSAGIAGIYILVYLGSWEKILGIFSPSEAVLSKAADYVWWVVAIPAAGFIPFMIDGILLGATQTRILRNTMFAAVGVFFALYYILRDGMGNDALWLSFLAFIILRGVLLWFATDRLSPDRLLKAARIKAG